MLLSSWPACIYRQIGNNGDKFIPSLFQNSCGKSGELISINSVVTIHFVKCLPCLCFVALNKRFSFHCALFEIFK